MTYSEKLKDPRWQKRRLEVLAAANWTCSTCDATEKTLHVHHNFYRSKTEPWDYPDHALSVLCESCHDQAENHRREFKMTMEGLSETDSMYFAVPAVTGFMKALRMQELLAANPDHKEKLKDYAEAWGFARFYQGDERDLIPQLQDGYVTGDVAESLWGLNAVRFNKRLMAKKEAAA